MNTESSDNVDDQGKKKKKLNGLDKDMWKALVKDGNVSGVRELLDTYEDLAERDVYGKDTAMLKGMKALHVAAYRGHVGVVELLIQNGCDVGVFGPSNKTSLHYAVDGGHADVVKLLIQNGADVNALDESKGTTLHSTAWKGSVEVAKILIQSGADVNALDEDDKSTLDYGVWMGHLDLVKLLIQSGSDVNSCHTDVSPLHVAISKTYVNIAKLLIRNGADVNVLDKENRSVVYCVSSFCDSVSLTLELICLGAKIDKHAFSVDKTGLLCKIEARMKKLRDGDCRVSNLYSNEEGRFMWNIALCLTLKTKASARRAYNTIRSFVTFNGIFMAPGFDLGDTSIWTT